MKLYLLRHGHADWPHWTDDDDARPLTKEGIAEMRTVAAALKRMKIHPEVIFASPLPRALHTAELAAGPLAVPVRQYADLAPGFDQQRFSKLLGIHAEANRDADLMLVGHEPDLSSIVGNLTGGSVKFSKASIAAVELERSRLSDSQLLWFLPAKMLIRLYQ